MISMTYKHKVANHGILALSSPSFPHIVARKLRPKTGPAHSFALTPTPVTVSRYKTPNATSRQQLLHNDHHLYEVEKYRLIGAGGKFPFFI